MAKNLYQILGVSPDANIIEIIAAYQALELKFHPIVDKKNLSAQETAQFEEIRKAYETLKDSAARKKYDKENGIVVKTPSKVNDNKEDDTDNDEDDDIENDIEADEDEDIDTDDDDDDEGIDDDDDDDDDEDIDNDDIGDDDDLSTPPVIGKRVSFFPVIRETLSVPFVWFLLSIIVLTILYANPLLLQKYTLVSTVEKDTVYLSTKNNETVSNEIKKGEKVEVFSIDEKGAWTHIAQGKIKTADISTPKNDYIEQWWGNLLLFIIAFICLTAALLLPKRLIAVCLAYNKYRKYPLSKVDNINIQNISYCINQSVGIVYILIVMILTAFLYYLAKEQYKSLALSYAFSSEEGSFIDTLLEIYQNHETKIDGITCLFIYLIINFIGVTISLNKYTCPSCNTPFNFFVKQTYESNSETFYKTEYRETYVNGHQIKAPYRQPYRHYTLNVIKACETCDYEEHHTSSKTERID